MKKKFSLVQIVYIGVMAALVCAVTFFRFPLLGSKVHFANAMCLLSGLLMGAVPGGLAAGIGSALYDLQDPAWAPEFWLTFLNKFTMSLVAGLMMRALKRLPDGVKVWISGICGILAYCILYTAKNLFYNGMVIFGLEWKQAMTVFLTTKLPVTLVNGVIAVLCAGALCLALKPALKKARLV